jgi:hypothetical protein
LQDRSAETCVSLAILVLLKLILIWDNLLIIIKYFTLILYALIRLISLSPYWGCYIVYNKLHLVYLRKHY